jgi:hypothetical protein
VGALGHYLESEGLATAGISLIRLHTEKIRPPRALFVPFELGRPLGVPGDAAFQTRVLRALINLLAEQAGPVLRDYPEDAPAIDPAEMEGMVCPVGFAPARQDETLASRVRLEIAALEPWYALSRERRGRTTYGLSGLDLGALTRFLTSWLDGTVPASPLAGQSVDAVLKLAVEDIKAFYLEATQAQPSAASSKARYDWFWTESAAARMLAVIRDICLAADTPALRKMGTNYLVPRVYFSHFGIADMNSPSKLDRNGAPR